jgi:hypothetical protein
LDFPPKKADSYVKGLFKELIDCPFKFLADKVLAVNGWGFDCNEIRLR